MCLVDFEEAFGTVEHETLCMVLEEQGVHRAYIDLIKALYKDQTATVTAGCQSRTFALQRRVKQGDPISALLFIAAMEAVFGRLKQRWHRRNTERRTEQYYGIVVDNPSDPLTNLRCADDVILFGTSKGDIGKMITELSQEAKKYGLKLLNHAEMQRVADRGAASESP